MPEIESRKVVGFLRQIIILLWKNSILLRRNISGTIAEILVTLIFVFILLFIRFFVDSTRISDENSANNTARNVIEKINFTLRRDLIMYYPNNAYVQTIVNDSYSLIRSQMPMFHATIVPSPVEDGANLDSSIVSNLFALVSFPSTLSSAATIPANLQYKIFTQEKPPYQYYISANFYSSIYYMFTNSPEYYCSSRSYTILYETVFNPIKHAVDLTLINRITSTTINDPTQIKSLKYFCPGYDSDVLKSTFAFFSVIIIQIAFLFTLIVNVGNIIVEKQTKMKEYLKMVGIKWYVIWITWLIRILIPYMILSLLLSIIVIAQLSPRVMSPSSAPTKAIFLYTNWFVGFSTFFVYSIQTSLFIILLGQIFSKTFIAKVFAILFWLATAIDFHYSLTDGAKYFLCFMPNVGLKLAFHIINQYERSGKSLDYSSLYTNLFGDGLNLGGVLACMLSYSILYIPIAWYIERIFPGEYGAPLPLYFPFMPSYWRPSRKVADDSLKFLELKKAEFGFENEPENLNIAISIQNISKKFVTTFKEKTVVNNMSLNIFENQITGLLGHNGAGKTTTTFMLCGIYAPDSGNAYILNKSIRTQLNEIRSSLGFCPQHDILFDDLTVAEHLDLIASIKGYSRKEVKKEIQEISTYVGLENDLEKKSKQLSGGMKRRLSVAMALTGGSKVIILDEPTSGLDPFNRRTLWELIRKFKQGRSIVLTTHFMEEADALSDRIAIMNHGEVKCCGSPLFLKNTFGAGYRLTISKNDKFIEEKFKSTLNSELEKYLIEADIAAEMSISLPLSSSSKLPSLLSNIEENKDSFGIDGYGISSPTIEEVFIKVGSIDSNDKYDTKEKNETKMGDQPIKIESQSLSNAFAKEFNKNAGITLWLQQIKHLWVKRFWVFVRRYILAFLILFLPFLMEGILSAVIPSSTTLIDTIKGVVSSSGSYELTVNNYSTQTIPYYINGSNSNIENLLASLYTQAKRPSITLEKITSDVNDYVMQLRKSDIKNLVGKYYLGMNLNMTNNKLYATLFYNSMAFHSSANILNEIDNILLYLANGNSMANTITTINSPLSSNSSLSSTTSYLDAIACLDTLPASLLNFSNAIIVALMISFMVMHVARERTNGSKQLQMLSGIHFTLYWISNYLFDLIIYVFNISTMVFILKMVDLAKNDSTSEVNAVAGTDGLGYIYLLLLFSCFSWCTLAYIWSFLFKSDIIGFVVLAVVLGFAAFVDVVCTFIQLIIINSNSNQANGASNFFYAVRIILLLLFPNVVIKRGMYNVKIRSNSNCISSVNTVLATSYTVNEDYMSINEPGLGLLILFSVIQFIVGNIILFVIESGVLRKIDLKKIFRKKNEVQSDTTLNLETDVEFEFNRIKNADIKELSVNEPLVVSDLIKTFNKNKKEFTAVNRLSFGITPKECFGFLGLNGAGKTTTFKILTGEIKASSGCAFINGYNVETERYKALHNLGFCPQFDSLPEYLTVEHAFNLFAGLRGLEAKSMKSVLDELIAVFKLDEYRNKLVQDLSGGNKRKVSSAIAFIGRPSVVFLDEPTTGMDPAARRYLWRVIKTARDMGMTIVLTTHNMEECEALSTKLGIMVNGQFKCLGSIQNLKSKFGKGYTLIVKCKKIQDDEMAKVEEFIAANVKFAKVKDKQQETLFYQIENDQNDMPLQTIAELFTLIETNKLLLNIETYSLSQTTLEQVFLLFAREQKSLEA